MLHKAMSMKEILCRQDSSAIS